MPATGSAKGGWNMTDSNRVAYRDYVISRGYVGFVCWHNDYDGPPDVRCGFMCRSVDDAKRRIDELIESLGE